jgi:hypothetical protein
MKKTVYLITLLIVLCGLITVTIIADTPVILSQYVGDYNIDDNEDKEDVKKAVNKEEKKNQGLPPYIAYNIKAVKIPYMNDSVRLSWNIHPDYDDQFIIGRSDEIIDTSERALASESISIVTSKSKNIYIDQGLKPGNYYYVIISRGKIHEKDIELYRDVNFTSFPVLIKQEDLNVKNITNISAKSIGSDKILVRWNKVSSKGYIYLIYRASYIIDTENKLKNAKRVGVVIDNDEFIDENISHKGDLYYAISIKDTKGKEVFTPVSNQSYTARSVKFLKNLTKTVSNIESSAVDSRSIRIKWKYSGENVDTNIKGFDIYRSNNMINTPEKIDSATLIKTVSQDITEYVDMVSGAGRYYYAVFVKFQDGITNISLVKDNTFTTRPVVMSEEFRFISIKALPEGKSVRVRWKYSGVPPVRYYRLFRSKMRINMSSSLKKSDILKIVDITNQSYLDNSPLLSGAYYGMIPEKRSGNTRLISGKNITRKIAIPGKGIRAADREEFPESGNIDDILRRTFFKGYYRESVKELKNIIKNTDNNRDIAKAELFLGRSYIEMKEYKKAIGYLVRSNVKRYYSREARFWRDFAMMRISR